MTGSFWLGGRASISQIRAPQPHRVSRTQGQFCYKRAVPQPTNFVPGNSGFIQTQSPLPSQSTSKDAEPHGLSVFGTSGGPASHAAPSVLAETSSSSTCLASWTPPCQGDSGVRCSSGPLEKSSVNGTGFAPGHVLQLEDKPLSHRSVLRSHLECLGLRVNFVKSALSPSQRISFLGTVIDSARMKVVVTPERALAIQQHAASFKPGIPHPLKVFQRILGLMASASLVLQLGLLHLQPLQYWLKPRVLHGACPWAWSTEGRWSRQMPAI